MPIFRAFLLQHLLAQTLTGTLRSPLCRVDLSPTNKKKHHLPNTRDAPRAHTKHKHAKHALSTHTTRRCLEVSLLTAPLQVLRAPQHAQGDHLLHHLLR